MKTASQILGLWPSLSALSKDIGRHYNTVRSWSERDSIPGKHWAVIIDSATMRGIHGVTLAALADAMRKDKP
jgi:hypothetical protein